MPYYAKTDYTFKKFEKAHNPKKKYDAILVNKDTGREVRVPFGATGYEQYADKTGLGLYKHLDHHDAKRRAAYRIRHAKDMRAGFYSFGSFAWQFLW